MIDHVPTIAAVPVKDQVHYTRGIVADLLVEPGVDGVLILDNGSTDGTVPYLAEVSKDHPKVVVVERPEAGIYDLWREAFATARRWWTDVPVNLLLLNNDLRLWRGTATALARALRLDPDAWIASPDPTRSLTQGPRVVRGEPSFLSTQVRGSYRHGGILGYAFLAAAEKFTPPEIDPAFAWWYGDDDLALSVDAAGGKCLRVVGLPIDHVGEGTSRHDRTIGERIDRDRAYFEEKWPGW